MGKQLINRNCTDFESQRVIGKKKKKCQLKNKKNGGSSSMVDKKPASFFVDGGDLDSGIGQTDAFEESPKQTLQDAFLTYRKKRHEKMVAAGKATKKRRLKRCDPRRMMALRKMFVEQCLKYSGTPYKRKYHEPGTREYNSPLFLDCCGLIRKVLQDLKTDFGFEIGPWNQTYMYDTLPNTILRESSMKPGDLVFISGVYFNEKMKSQIHGIVHVEVWLGEGRKTIGARWHKGVVQIFDSYRFKSTSYHSMKYHFKSINPWLMGICKSHCPMHAWRTPGDFRPSKRSVLHIKTKQQQQQQQQSKQQQQNASDVDQSQNTPRNEEQLTCIDLQKSRTDGRSNISTASSEDSQETLMKDILLSGSGVVDLLAEQLRILPVQDHDTPPALKKSLTYIQVTKSITQNSEEANYSRKCSSSRGQYVEKQSPRHGATEKQN
uniref:uncharacterized protein LOC120342469 isoform X2 n=1 Tax=Styela clava TaxID=7725 RepID=UPI00193A4C8C|nr:uncharacterized protein LOC120342469 isoform X2 [Styela clava]